MYGSVEGTALQLRAPWRRSPAGQVTTRAAVYGTPMYGGYGALRGFAQHRGGGTRGAYAGYGSGAASSDEIMRFAEGLTEAGAAVLSQVTVLLDQASAFIDESARDAANKVLDQASALLKQVPMTATIPNFANPEGPRVSLRANAETAIAGLRTKAAAIKTTSAPVEVTGPTPSEPTKSAPPKNTPKGGDQSVPWWTYPLIGGGVLLAFAPLLLRRRNPRRRRRGRR